LQILSNSKNINILYLENLFSHNIIHALDTTSHKCSLTIE